MTAITAITAQNTVEVRAVAPVAPEMIRAQVAAVVEDIGVDAVKVGMLGSVATIEAVAAAIRALAPGTPVVVDPVMVSESGGRLLETDAEAALREQILPLAAVVTPNVAEARVLAREPGGDAPLDDVGAERLVRAIHGLGPGAVVLTGGHRETVSDVLFDGRTLTPIAGERYAGGAAHGSGCTHSSVLAARLAHGDSLLEAARAARRVAGEAVRDGLREIGHGPGPVDVLGLTRPATGPLS
jgi:hydroxymethylpyrimidine/phosphomethylpyrimidine kinase